MKDHHHRRRNVLSWSKFFCSSIFILFTFLLFSASTFRHYFGEKFKPEIVSGWPRPAMEATVISTNSPAKPSSISIQETVILPDQVLLFLNYPPSFHLFSKQHLNCLYFSPNSTRSNHPKLKLSPDKIDRQDSSSQIVRCALSPRGFTVSLEVKSFGSTGTDNYIVKNLGPTLKWDSLVYEAMLDRDNTTVVFVKGLNLRSDKVYDSSKFECVYGWDFTMTKFLLRSNVISIAQEIVRCRTPLSILNNQFSKVNNTAIKVSIRFKGRGTLHSIARPGMRSFIDSNPGPRDGKMFDMCVCTMLRNQGRFLKEWIMYHGSIGVQRWFIYDNNSDDDIESVLEWLGNAGFNVTRHVWPWVKTQEEFAHCALRAQGLCEWVGFIDVDEFLHLPTRLNLQDAIGNQSQVRNNVAELRVSCHSFGPSGSKHVPAQGVTVGYTCRMMVSERHKSIVKPEALNSTLINVVHHFHLRKGYKYVNADRGLLIINHYKYQVWEVFKEKFYRRVATYVADWQDEQNVGSKDRAPGLGTRAVEPSDWPSRFCEVTDTGLRDRVLENFKDPLTDLLPWQEEGILNQEDSREGDWLQ